MYISGVIKLNLWATIRQSGRTTATCFLQVETCTVGLIYLFHFCSNIPSDSLYVGICKVSMYTCPVFVAVLLYWSVSLTEDG